MKDILGTALLDYFHGNYTEDILTETNISEEDELPLPYLFRSFSDMPPLEKKALKLAKGKILNISCGTGSHALYLQEKGFEVTAIETSKGAVEVCKLRGVKNVKKIELLQYSEEKFDTILMLMNGTGIFEKLENVHEYLQYLKSLLNEGGQILIDSSDLKYMYDEGEDGSIWIPADRYYGELEFTMKYKGMLSETFNWLYLDERIFENACEAANLNFKIMSRGENFDYLAKLY